MSSSTQKNLEAIVKAVEQHDANCTEKGKAVCLCPYEFDRLGFESVTVAGRSVPIKSDDSLGTGRFRVLCDGYHGPKKEIEEEETVEAPNPRERELVPVGAPSEEEHTEWMTNEGRIELTFYKEMTLEEYRLAWEGSGVDDTSYKF